MEIFIHDPTLRKGYFFFCKTKDWSNEDEVRLVQSRIDPHNKVKINAKSLTRIIIGKDMTPENEAQIREWAKQRESELTVAKASYDAVSRSIKIREGPSDVS